MSASHSRQPVQHIHRQRGQTERMLAFVPEEPEPTRVPSIADLVPVTHIMTREISCARPDLEVKQIAELMVKHHIGCIPVVNDAGSPTGIVTKRDLVERLGTGVEAQTARDLMMPLAITLGPRATVAHAAAIMALEDIHHVPIVDDGGLLIGIVSTMDIVRWLAANDGFTTPG